MTLRADVVIIGAGAIGLAVALEALRLGIADVLVVDAAPAPGQGSTGRANGGVRAQFTTAVNIEFSRFTIERLAALDEATAGLVGLRRTGYLFMTGTTAGEAALSRAHALQRACGVDVEWLTPAGVVEHAPFVRAAGLRAGTFCAADGLIDPHGVIRAMWSEGRRLGLRSLLGERVVALQSTRSAVRVHTSHTVIVARHAVNAAGPQAREVAAMADVALPVVSYRRNLACTEPVEGFPEHIPMCVDADTGVLIRREARGFLIAFSDPADPPATSTTFDRGFLEALSGRVGNRFPFLESIAIDERKCWAGLYPQTPDHHAIIDSADASPRLIHCAGFGGHGIMHSLAAGRAVAELLRDGRCETFDLHPLRLSRFVEGDSTVETAVL